MGPANTSYLPVVPFFGPCNSDIGKKATRILSYHLHLPEGVVASGVRVPDLQLTGRVPDAEVKPLFCLLHLLSLSRTSHYTQVRPTVVPEKTTNIHGLHHSFILAIHPRLFQHNNVTRAAAGAGARLSTCA